MEATSGTARRRVGFEPTLARALALVGLSLAVACGRSVRTGQDASGTGGAAGDPSSTGGTPTGGSGAGVGGGDGAGGGVGGTGGALDCTTSGPPDAPLRRLTRFEYENTLRDLLGLPGSPADTLPHDLDDPLTPVSAAAVEGYHSLSHEFAARATRDAETTRAFVGCDPLSDGAPACRRDFIESFVSRVFRRPITAADLDAFTGVFSTGEGLGGDFSSGVRAVVEVALQSPEFLYKPEFGEPAAERGADWARPTPYEMATRLSYLYWGAPPDETLLEAAARDELRSDGEIDAQARRLLAHERARDAVGHFYLHLLELAEPTFPASESAEHPSFTAEVAELLPRETAAFTSELTLGGEGDFRALLTAPYTLVNGPLADFYGIAGVSGDEFQRADWGDARRAGVLMQAGVLASTSNGPYTNPSQRGHLVGNAFLCFAIPGEPPGVTGLPPPAADMTTREQYEHETGDAVCAGCHATFNPLGFAFEHFDAAGLWRDTDNGHEIDASGEIVDTDAAGPFDGALELSQRLAESADAKRCFVANWFAFAHGRAATDDDACSLQTLDRAFVNGDENLRELLLALTTTDAFRYLREVTP